MADLQATFWTGGQVRLHIGQLRMTSGTWFFKVILAPYDVPRLVLPNQPNNCNILNKSQTAEPEHLNIYHLEMRHS